MSGILRANGVCKYFGGLKAVENVDMEIARGDIFGIIGPNGAGKTTFFNICTGIYGPTKGSVYLEEEEITGLSPDKVAAKGMARTFQNIQLFKYLTVRDNVKIGFHLHTKTRLLDAILHTKAYQQDEKMIQEASEAILERVGLIQYRDSMAGMLPYGIQRKVEIARALATSPKVLLLDEPAAGMNEQESEELCGIIRDIPRNFEGITILVIDHHMDVIMSVCDEITVINFGKQLATGTPAEIQKNQAVIDAYLGVED